MAERNKKKRRKSKQSKPAAPPAPVVEPFNPTPTDFGGNFGGGSMIAGSAVDLVCDVYGRTVPWVQNLLGEGAAAFLVGRGWSATPENLIALNESGIPAMAVNNYPREFKPRFWASGDPGAYFHRAVWMDPKVMKFTPFHNRNLPVPLGDWEFTAKKARDCPNVQFYNQRCNSRAGSFLAAPWADWGTAAHGMNDNLNPDGGFRSSMLAAIRILFHLGARSIYLLGCDFTPGWHPDPQYPDRIAEMLKTLNTVFGWHELSVFNCNEGSHLRAFPFVPFQRALHTIRSLPPSLSEASAGCGSTRPGRAAAAPGVF